MAEQILHFGSVTLRVNGSGNLKLTMIGLDRVKSKTLSDVVMVTSPGKEPSRLVNFKSQRALLRMETTAIDEYMKINRVVIFSKPLWTQFPSS